AGGPISRAGQQGPADLGFRVGAASRRCRPARLAIDGRHRRHPDGRHPIRVRPISRPCCYDANRGTPDRLAGTVCGAPTPDNWVASAGDLLAAGRRGTSTRRCARFHRRPATPIRDPWGTLLAARPARSRVRLLRLHHTPPTPIGGETHPAGLAGWVCTRDR